MGKEKKKTKLSNSKKVFPTEHPFVENEDGGISNVKLMSVGFGEGDDYREYAIPTMVGGIQLNEVDAIAVAREHGLSKYPSFKDVATVEEWIHENHGNINEKGHLVRPPPKKKKENKTK